MTTLISQMMKDKNEILAKWKAKVGEKKAAAISEAATTAGKSYHAMVEDYLQNKLDIESLSDTDAQRLIAARSSLDRIDNIRHIEQTLYSNSLRLAGTVDAIADFDGVLSVIDHKTSKRLKKEEWVESYFLQEAGYCLLYEEMTGTKIDQIVTIISIENANFCQVFKRSAEDYKPRIIFMAREFYETNEIVIQQT